MLALRCAPFFILGVEDSSLGFRHALSSTRRWKRTAFGVRRGPNLYEDPVAVHGLVIMDEVRNLLRLVPGSHVAPDRRWSAVPLQAQRIPDSNDLRLEDAKPQFVKLIQPYSFSY